MTEPAYARFFLPFGDDARIHVQGRRDRESPPPAPVDAIVLRYLPSEPGSLLDAAARSLTREGTLVVIAANAAHGRLLLPKAVELLRRSRPVPDEEIHTEQPRTLSGYRRLLSSAGFSQLQVLAPLPDAARPHVVVGLDGAGPARFTFDRRVRRNSPGNRIAAAVGSGLARTGLLAAAVPWFLLVARR